jgi:prepilin-type N-terminal cleavage/methylation domain-containing protein/prepilin-type processing-associated H-X9-DG protein
MIRSAFRTTPTVARRVVGPQNPAARGRRAFTLIEVLVVVAIIALLVAILLPALARVRDQARSVVCRSNVRQLMNGMFLYVADYDVFPGTHSLFYMQGLFGTAWPRISGVTWDGARDRLVGLTYTAAYTQPHYLDPEFVADVPRKGTLFRYIKDEKPYTCPADRPGEATDTPLGGGGNGRLSYSFNAYIGYKAPEDLRSFTYVAPSLNNPLPGHQKTRSFTAGQRVVFTPARFMTMFEEHPFSHMNTSFPEGNFNGLDRIATRHMFTAGSQGRGPAGRASIAFLDGHVESPLYPVKTAGRELFAEFGEPYVWRENAPPDTVNIAAFITRLHGPCPW